MRRTLMASAVALALGFSGYAMANPCSDNEKSCDQKSTTGANSLTSSATSGQTTTTGSNANEVASYATVTQDSFNSSKVVALSKLEGSVTYVGVSGIGNVAKNWGSAAGGSGGKAGNGHGGAGYGGSGGNSGNSGSGGDGGTAKNGSASAGSITNGSATAGTGYGGEGGRGGSAS